MIFLYNILFAVGFAVLSPYYFYRLVRRGNYRKGFMQRFGFYPPAVRNLFYRRGCIWFRAVSVGEVHEALTIIWEIRQQQPEVPMALSVTTTTGYQTARRRAPEGVAVTYYPVDFSWCVRRALRCFQPRLIVLVESDIWPNLMRRAAARKIPVALINARISDKSLRGYQRAGALFRPAFQRLALACAPDEATAARLEQVGIAPHRIQIVGSLKYEVAALPERKSDFDPMALLRAAGAKPAAPILVAGSTHRGEEAIFLELLPRLRREFPDLFLVLAPRHAERRKEVAKLAARHNVVCVPRTALMQGSGESIPAGGQCLLLDTTGDLRAFYRAATIIFVGKSLVGRGGQNILEAAITGHPVVFGPHMENFKVIAGELVKAGGAIQVADAAELETALRELLASPERREKPGEQALKVFQENLGSAERTTERLLALMTAAGSQSRKDRRVIPG